ncbi:MAG: hypothetical protein ABJE47_11695, partial [bacterium]
GVGVPRYEMSGIHYGLLWWVIDYPWRGRTIRAYFAGGNGGQVTMVVPDVDMVVTVFGANYADAGTYVPQRRYVPQYILPAVR